MILKLKLFLLFLLFFYGACNYAQFDKTINLLHTKTIEKNDFYHFKNNGGMEQNSFTHITQDSIGQMWFATKNGVIRYDSKSFYNYKHNPKNSHSIGGNFVERVFVDKDRNIWVGTEPAVLSKYHTETDDFRTIKGISGQRIKDIVQDQDGLLWISSSTNLYSYNDKTKKLNTYTYKKNEGIDRLVIIDNHLYISTNNIYLLDFNLKTKTFKRIDLIHKEDKVSTRSTATYSAFVMTKDHNNTIWLSYPNGYLIQYNPKIKKLFKYSYETKWKPAKKLTIMFILEDKEHNLWFGTWFNGLYKIFPDRKHITRYMPDQDNPHSISNSIVHSGFQDKGDYLWFGTEFAGINILKKNKKFNIIAYNKKNNNSLPPLPFNSIVKDINNRVWLTIDGDGLYYYDTNNPNQYFKNNSITKNNWLFALFRDSNNFIWVGGEDGLHKYNPTTKKTIHFKYNKNNYNSLIPGAILTINEDSFGNIWAGSAGGGLCKMDVKTNKFYRFVHDDDNPKSLSNDIVKTIYFDSNTNLWVGTFDGLNKFNTKTGDFTIFKHSYKNKNSISSNRINSIHEKKNKLWIGSYEGGLTSYDFSTKKFKSFYKEDGLPDNNVKGINSDNNNNLWISTTNNISKFNLKTNQFINYGASDGLQNSVYIENLGLQNLEFHSSFAYKDKQGLLYFGGVSGFTVFDPNQLPKNNYKPPVIINYFQVNGKSKDLINNSILLNPKQNNIKISLTPINFIQSDKNKIAYKLEGLDSIWHYAKPNKTIEYLSLNPGHYNFLYKGANNDGIWNTNFQPIAITVKPYFYQTTLFYTLIALSVILLIIVFVLYKIYLKKQFNEQKKKLKYSSSNLKESTAVSINKRLISTLEKDELYLEADLSLHKLAKIIDTKPHDLSQVINQIHQCSFHEFINKYRITESKKLLIETQLKIEAVAYDSGFNSISTFNAVFKKETGITPSKFRKTTKK